VDGSRIRKEKVPDSKISGYVWTGPKTNARKLGVKLTHLSIGAIHLHIF